MVLLGLFIIYLVIMYFNAKYSAQIDSVQKSIAEEEDQEEGTSPLQGKSHQEWKKIRNVMRSTISQYRRARIISTKRIILTDVHDQDEIPWFQKISFFKYLLFPMILLFRISLPKPNKCTFILTFILSIIWLGALTYVSVWMVTIIGKHKNA